MEPVSQDMRRIITERLREIAKVEDILILFAIESGSRAWGFHSPDSDYDVRFVYARSVDWHLKLGKKRDVIECLIDDELDLSGWELSKALSLAMSSNAVIGEWLQSPIRYCEAKDAVATLTDFSRRALTRRPVTWHYLSMLQAQHRRIFTPDGKVRLKRYFYALRPMLALRWMRLNNKAMPPMSMSSLMQGAALSTLETEALDRMIKLKQSTCEKDEAEATDPLLDALIDSEIDAAHVWVKTADKDRGRTALWEDANHLHQRFTRMAGE